MLKPNELALAAEYLYDYDDIVSGSPCDCELDYTAENRTIVEAAMAWHVEEQGEGTAQLVVRGGKILTKHYILVGYLSALLLDESGIPLDKNRFHKEIARSV